LIFPLKTAKLGHLLQPIDLMQYVVLALLIKSMILFHAEAQRRKE